ncbi:MAG: MarR family transcriptional regulator [Bacteroidales bacterium]|nr:MarR family transcriptional regulator [Bacteroidales bacterium]
MAHEELRLGNQLCFRFYTVSRLITQAYREHLEPLGLTYPQYLVMLVLWEQDNQPVNDIAKRLVLNTNTVTPLLKRMEEEDLVSRRRSPEDERKVIVSLTEKGRNLEKTARKIPQKMAQAYAHPEIDEAKMLNLYQTLDTLIGSLQA